MAQEHDTDKVPLIVTLRLDNKSHQFFNHLRKQYFPPAINYLDAHLTMFHHLPSDEPAVTEALVEMAGRSCFEMEVSGLIHTGYGVAFAIESAGLISLRAALQHKFHEWLIPQDKQKFRPHITIQNKVTPEMSKKLHRELSKVFTPFPIVAEGIDTWLYRNGPWEHRETFSFTTT